MHGARACVLSYAYDVSQTLFQDCSWIELKSKLGKGNGNLSCSVTLNNTCFTRKRRNKNRGFTFRDIKRFTRLFLSYLLLAPKSYSRIVIRFNRILL